MMRLGGILTGTVLALALAGCESFRLFNDYSVVESPEVEAAPYPRLVDVPEAPPPGQFNDAVPDPAEGVAVETQLEAAAARADRRRQAAARPVLTDTQRATLDKARTTRKGERRAPILTPAERAELRRRTQRNKQ